MECVIRKYVLFLSILFIAILGLTSNARAGFVYWDNPDYYGSRPPGGFAALGEIGADYVLASVQGDAPDVMMGADLQYIYPISRNDNVSITYSVIGEATSLYGASLSFGASVRVRGYYNSVGPIISGTNFYPEPRIDGHWSRPTTDMHQTWDYGDQVWSRYWSDNYDRMIVTLSASVRGMTYDAGYAPYHPEAFYSATMYVDPIVIVNGTEIHPIGGYVDFTSFSDSRGQQYVPVPATVLLLGSGLIGLAGFRRKYKNR